MARHFTLESKSPYSPKATDTTLNIVIWSDNRGPAGQPTLHSSMHVMFDASDKETWDQLWLLQNDIRNALDAARPGTFYPIPAEEAHAAI